MNDSDSPQLPDVLGSITGGERCTIGVMQLAFGVRPRVARAGRPFEALLLAQNSSDSRVDLTATLQIPEGFISKRARIVVGIGPAEVGYIVLPVSALANTPPGSACKLAVTVEVKTHGKSIRARPPEAGPLAVGDDLSPENAALFEALKDVSFSTSKRFGRSTLETSIDLLSGNIGRITDFAPGWVSLWTYGDIRDDAILLRRFAALFRVRVLPTLQHDHTLELLTSETDKRFAEAGYPLVSPEALLIAKTMALVLEFALPTESSRNPLEAGSYNVAPLLSGSGNLGESPRWFRAMLHTVGHDVRLAFDAPLMVQRLLYKELLQDAMMHAFTIIERETGEDLGSAKERQMFADQLVSRLEGREGVNFVQTYMPLVIGGIMVSHEMTAPEENAVETLRQMWLVLDERRVESGENENAILEMAELAVERGLETYGFNRRLT